MRDGMPGYELGQDPTCRLQSMPGPFLAWLRRAGTATGARGYSLSFLKTNSGICRIMSMMMRQKHGAYTTLSPRVIAL